MISNEQIERMLSRYNDYIIEMLIIVDCSGVSSEDQAMKDPRYRQLKQRTSLVDHWLSFISREESIVLKQHFMECETWQGILSKNLTCGGKSIGTDRRTLQRVKKRGIKKIHEFMNDRFANSLPHLFVEDDSIAHEIT